MEKKEGGGLPAPALSHSPTRCVRCQEEKTAREGRGKKKKKRKDQAFSSSFYARSDNSKEIRKRGRKKKKKKEEKGTVSSFILTLSIFLRS